MKYITTQQILAAILATKMPNASNGMIRSICHNINFHFKNEYEVVVGDFKMIQPFIEFVGKNIKIKDGYTLETQLKASSRTLTLKEYFESVAGREVMGVIRFLLKKSCNNCVNSGCKVPFEDSGVDMDGLPEGNQCIEWENSRFEEMAFKRM